MIPEVVLAPTLSDLEKRISLALGAERTARVDIGEALIEIRERRLYLDLGANTFDEYCRKRWAFSRSRAYQLIDLALVHRQRPEIVTEVAARKIAPTLPGRRHRGGQSLIRDLTAPTRNRAERDRAANGTCDEVHIVLGFYNGDAIPLIRVASCQDRALDIRDELTATGNFRKVRVLCQEVER